MTRDLWLAALIALCTCCLAPGRAAAVPPHALPAGTAVLSDSADAYYTLALEMARLEGIPLAHSLDELFEIEPEHVLWVLSPAAFGDSILTRFGVEMGKRELPVSWGIITGSTIDLARELCRRSLSFTGALARVDARDRVILIREDDAERIMPLDKDSLSLLLPETRYLVFSGHGGSRYWRLGDGTPLEGGDIPRLSPLFVTTGACNTFKPWIDGSIALAFADRGAAAYAGFLFSPAPYYLFGHTDGYPLQHTWPGFPSGLVVRMQNLGTLKSFARFPFYHLLGDPRLAFRPAPPYRLTDDRISGGRRTLTFSAAPPGFIPVRIAEGAGYGFVEIEGVSSAGGDDWFYNSKLQRMEIGEDLLILFRHAGGDFTVRLQREPPPFRRAADCLADAFDHAYIYLPSTSGTTFFLIVSACVLFGTLWFAMRKGLKLSGFREALAVGVILAVLKTVYALSRMDHSSVVSFDCTFNPHFFVGAFVLAGCGTLLFFNVHSRRWKAVSLLIATFPTWAVACFWLAGIACINLFGASPRLGTQIYRYSIGILPAVAFAAEGLILMPVLLALSRRVGRDG